MRPPNPPLDLDARAKAALVEATRLEPGADRTAALKKAELLRNAADIHALFFAKRPTPAN
jgi:hypothetical protein